MAGVGRRGPLVTSMDAGADESSGLQPHAAHMAERVSVLLLVSESSFKFTSELHTHTVLPPEAGPGHAVFPTAGSL